MDEVPIAGVHEARDSFKTFQAMYGAPAYVRRALEVEATYEGLLQRCRKQREEWLPMVRLRLGVLRELAGDWPALLPCLASPEDLDRLRRLHEELAPELRCPVGPTSSLRRLRRALAELRESMELFNRRWQEFLPRIDLAPVNELREGYNRWYVLEKECAVRSPRLAREGFRRLEPLTIEHLFALMPLLPVPALAP